MTSPVFTPPELGDLETAVLGLIEQLHEQMRHRVATPTRWASNLRRMTFARAVQGSNSIEGYHASLDDVVAVVEDEPALDANEETRLALLGYRDAMTYVLQVAKGGDTRIDEGLLKALHFMMLKHDMSKSPGHWRPGYIAVRREETAEIVYEGPDADAVPALIDSMLTQLAADDGPVLVRAAMAHLNLVMVHPYRDGNGRMARCLQTLVLAREQIVAPVFSSIEEYLGRNTQAYHDVLAEVGKGAWHPHHSARPWVRFCLTAHYRQMKTHLRRVEEIEQLWLRCLELAQVNRLAERTAGGLFDAALGLRVRNGSYRGVVETTSGESISELTASRDLKAMVDAGLLQPVGERRGRFYVGPPQVRAQYDEIRAARPPREEYDPFVVAQERLQLSFGA